MSPIRVLIVDASEEMRMLSRVVLELDSRFEVCGEATSGQAALVMLEHIAADVVVLDLTIARAYGMSPLRTLRRKHPLVPVVALTSIDTYHVRQGAREHGAYAVLSKQDAPYLLAPTLRDAFCSRPDLAAAF